MYVINNSINPMTLEWLCLMTVTLNHSHIKTYCK